MIERDKRTPNTKKTRCRKHVPITKFSIRATNYSGYIIFEGIPGGWICNNCGISLYPTWRTKK